MKYDPIFFSRANLMEKKLIKNTMQVCGTCSITYEKHVVKRVEILF